MSICFLFFSSNEIWYNVLNIFFLVLVSDWDILTSWLQFDDDHLSESVVFRRESILNDVGNIVFPVCEMCKRFQWTGGAFSIEIDSQHPFQRAEDFCIDTLHIY